MGENGFQQNQFLKGKNGQNKPENHQNWNLAKKIFFGKNKNHPQFLYHINQWKNTGQFDFGTFCYFQPYLVYILYIYRKPIIFIMTWPLRQWADPTKAGWVIVRIPNQLLTGRDWGTWLVTVETILRWLMHWLIHLSCLGIW